MSRLNVSFLCGFSVLISIGAVLCFGSPGCLADNQQLPDAPARDGAFAVVELFTSEGCSSCPPADDLLGQISNDAQKRGLLVFPIAFHIDYWDGLGWKDRFSLAAATDRQQRYAKVFSAEMYTPQMIVNGRTQFLGSDRDAYQKAVAEALKAPSQTRLALKLKHTSAGSVSIAYQTTAAAPECVVNLVVIQRSATTDVPRGENAGYTLRHVNIARSIKTIPLSAANGEASLTLPADLDEKDAMVIGYVQDPVSMKIAAAAKVDVAQ
jgi:hypothetical protein